MIPTHRLEMLPNVQRTTFNAQRVTPPPRLQIVGRGAREAHTNAGVVLFATCCDDVDKIIWTCVFVEVVRKAISPIQAAGRIGIQVVAAVSVRYGFAVLQLAEIDDQIVITGFVFGTHEIGPLCTLMHVRGNLNRFLRDVIDGRPAPGLLKRLDARKGGESNDNGTEREKKLLLARILFDRSKPGMTTILSLVISDDL